MRTLFERRATVRKTYQGRQGKSKGRFEVMGRKEMAVRLPLPLVEVWEELQPEVEHLTGLAGVKISRAVIEDEVTRRVGPRHQPDPGSSCLRWGQQAGYVVFAGQKVAVEHPRVRTRQGEEVQLDSYARLQHDGRRQRAVREGIVAGLTSRNYRRAVQSVLEGYGIEKSSVSRGVYGCQHGAVEETVREKTRRAGSGGDPD